MVDLDGPDDERFPNWREASGFMVRSPASDPNRFLNKMEDSFPLKSAGFQEGILFCQAQSKGNPSN